MCCFKFSVTFYCDSHLSQRFPGLHMHAFDKYGSDSFTGVRPLVVPAMAGIEHMSPEHRGNSSITCATEAPERIW